MEEYAGRILAERYRLPLPPSGAPDECEVVETRAFDTRSGQEVLVRQVPLPEIVDAEIVDAGTYDGHRAPAAGRRPVSELPAVRRAIAAAQAAARVPDHPRLDQVFDVFAEGNSLWIVSELLPARSLASLIAEEPLSPYRAAEVAADVLTALRVLHAHGWTHRNITTRTVLVCEDGRVVLTGLAAGAAEEALCGYDPVPPADPAEQAEDPAGGEGARQDAAWARGRAAALPAPRPPDAERSVAERPYGASEFGGPDLGNPGFGGGDGVGAPEGGYGYGPGYGYADGQGYGDQERDPFAAPDLPGEGELGGYAGSTDYHDVIGGGAGTTPDEDGYDDPGPSSPGLGRFASEDPGDERTAAGASGSAPGPGRSGGEGPGAGPSAFGLGRFASEDPGDEPEREGEPGAGEGGAPSYAPLVAPGYDTEPLSGPRPERHVGPTYADHITPEAPGGRPDPKAAARAGAIAAYRAGAQAAARANEERRGGGAPAEGNRPQGSNVPQGYSYPYGGPGATWHGATPRRTPTPALPPAANPGAALPPAPDPETAAPGLTPGAALSPVPDPQATPGQNPGAAFAPATEPNPGQGPEAAPGTAPVPDQSRETPPPDPDPSPAVLPAQNWTPDPGANRGWGPPPDPEATPGPDGTWTTGPGPEATPLPEGTWTAGQGSEATPLPDPTWTTGPGPEATPLPDPTWTTGPGPEATPLPDPTWTTGPGPEATPPPDRAWTTGPGPEVAPLPDQGWAAGPEFGVPASQAPGDQDPAPHHGHDQHQDPHQDRDQDQDRGWTPFPAQGWSDGPGAGIARTAPEHPHQGRHPAQQAPHQGQDPAPGAPAPGHRPAQAPALPDRLALPQGFRHAEAPAPGGHGPTAPGSPRTPAPGWSASRGAGPVSALDAERARLTRMAVVGAVTERWAPEQAGPVHDNWQLAAPIGPATDLWALGALLYRAVQGHAPYPEDSAAELVEMVCAEPPAFAEECGPLRPIVESLLRQDPTERPDFEELRGWLRSLVRSAPEPDVTAIGGFAFPLPDADPARLPAVRRKGDLSHGRHRGTQHATTRRPRGGRFLGRTLLLLVMAALAGGVAYAVFFLPRATTGEGDGGQARGGGPSAAVTPPGANGGANTPTGTPRSQPAPQSGGPSAPSAADAPAGYTAQQDPEGFRVFVPGGWERHGVNDMGQVRYTNGDFVLILTPGRDAVNGNPDPLSYQRDKERELEPFRTSTWATSTGVKQTKVGQQLSAEGQYTWTDGGGRSVYVRNRVVALGGRYHVVMVIGPQDAQDKVTEVFEKATGSYRPGS